MAEEVYTTRKECKVKAWKYDIRCCICGKFCHPYDEGIHFGNCCDLEPPDPEYFCEKCVKSLKVDEKSPKGWWHPPNFCRRVK